MKSAKEILHKLNSYLHHREFETDPLSENEIDKIMKDKKAVYNLKTDKRSIKFSDGDKLEKCSVERLPKYIQNNLDNYRNWID